MTQTTNNTSEATLAPATGRQKPIIVGVGIFIAIMFLISFYIRIQSPGLTMHRTESSQSMDQQAMGMGAMGDVGKLMEELGKKPNDVELLTTLAERFMSAQTFDKAEVFLNRALVAEPSNIRVMHHLGVTLFQMEKHNDSALMFEQILSMQPDDAAANYNLGILYKHFLKKPDQAQKHFQKVLDSPKADANFKKSAQEELGEKNNEHGTKQ